MSLKVVPEFFTISIRAVPNSLRSDRIEPDKEEQASPDLGSTVRAAAEAATKAAQLQAQL